MLVARGLPRVISAVGKPRLETILDYNPLGVAGNRLRELAGAFSAVTVDCRESAPRNVSCAKQIVAPSRDEHALGRHAEAGAADEQGCVGGGGRTGRGRGGHTEPGGGATRGATGRGADDGGGGGGTGGFAAEKRENKHRKGKNGRRACCLLVLHCHGVSGLDLGCD